MFSSEKKVVTAVGLLLVIATAVFTFLDWRTGEFDLLKAQEYKFYFQSWVSIAGFSFTLVMSLTMFIIYKKMNRPSLKFMSLSFLVAAVAYMSIGYHASYCKVCSDLAMCSATHNYSNYLIVIALIVFALTTLMMNVKNNIAILKLFSLGLIMASLILLIILFVSIQFMEIPDALLYNINQINLQGLVFIFPLILIGFTLIYLRKSCKVKKIIVLISVLFSLSFIPQAYHIFLCQECHVMECSEFYVVSGLMMFMALGLFIYSLSLQLKEDAL